MIIFADVHRKAAMTLDHLRLSFPGDTRVQIPLNFSEFPQDGVLSNLRPPLAFGSDGSSLSSIQPSND